MAGNPGSIGSQVPYGDDYLVRRQDDAARAAREQASARTGQAMQIGAGGILINGGGSLTISGSGSLNVGSGALNSAGSISAGTTITAGGAISGASVAATGAVSGASVAAAGQVSGNTGVFPGGVNSTDVYNHLLTYGGGYKNQYIHVDGTMGYVPSSRRFKQDIKTFTVDAVLAKQLRVVSFRYIAAVNNPEYEAVTEVGLIAEEVDALGLHWLVDYDDEGLPFGIKYERLVLALIPWMQSIEDRLTAAGI